ncbi:cytochrome C biogenesis protein [candidate division WOR-3 bacterium]|nr:cytochrome C biogenesis protein [candidate division WOR-3 bacterium]
MEEPSGLSLFFSFVWGILSVILSPCHLAGIPLIVGFMSGQGKVSNKKAFAISLSFTSGLLFTFAIIGIATALTGRMLGNAGTLVNYIVAAVFFLTGLNLLGVIPLPFAGRGMSDIKIKGVLGALILGLIFGVALGPCTFAFMAPVLGAALQAAKTNFVLSVLIFIFFGLGHGIVFVFAGTASEIIENYLKWNEKTKSLTIIKGVCGVLIILAGLWMIYTSH